MPHATTETYAVSFDATGNSSGTETVLEVTQGGTFNLERVTVFGEAGAQGGVEIQVFQGEAPVVPKQGVLALSPNYHPLPVERELGPGDELEVRWENTSATERSITVAASGQQE